MLSTFLTVFTILQPFPPLPTSGEPPTDPWLPAD